VVANHRPLRRLYYLRRPGRKIKIEYGKIGQTLPAGGAFLKKVKMAEILS
jgi:hypothetical protein